MGGSSGKRGGTVALGDALRGFLRESGLGDRLRHARVFGAFSEALGPQLGARAKPVHFQFGELTVEVESAAHLQELQSFTGDSYRQAANRGLGDEVIKKLSFRLKR